MTSVLEELNSALHRAFADDPRVYLLGEDVLDPYGGAFKVTRGLSSTYPERVLTTPISEAGITGVAAGMALRGLHPVLEIMFGDFLALAADQLVNHIAKFRWMYNDQVQVPLVIRTPMGGRRGYGPTHSQTMEKFFLGLPGLHVLAPCAFAASGDGPGDLLYHAITDNQDPVLFIENKLLYLLPALSASDLADFEINMSHTGGSHSAPTYRLTVRGAPPALLTLAAYGYMAELARQALLKLAYEHEIFSELVVLTQLSPFEISPVIDSVKHTRRLLVIEEGSLSLGWGAEILARTAETLSGQPLSLRRLGALDIPIPAAISMENAVLPGLEDIIETARNMP
jgi:pyruvate/2-oxoglutarate/acetoin dehydrogenase E1 component